MRSPPTKTTLTVKLASELEQGVTSLVHFNLQSGVMRHRIRPQDTSANIESVFISGFVDLLNFALGKLTSNSMVFTIPDFKVWIGDVYLEKIRIITTPKGVSGQSTFITFVDCRGPTDTLFAQTTSNMRKELSDISVDTIEYVASKTYQLLQARDCINSKSHQTSVQNSLDTIRKKREDLAFRLKLLKLASPEAAHNPTNESNDVVYRQIS